MLHCIAVSCSCVAVCCGYELQVSFAEYRLFYRALLQKRPIILSILLIEACILHLALRWAVDMLQFSLVVAVCCSEL